MHLRRDAVGQQCFLELVVPTQRVPPGVDDPARMVGGQRQPGRGIAAQGGQPLRPVTAGGPRLSSGTPGGRNLLAVLGCRRGVPGGPEFEGGAGAC